MKIKDWGEENFIQHLLQQFPITENLVGIGDDCAVIPTEQETSWLITTDAFVEGVHFLKEQIPPSDVGYKTIAVNVSDIAAMGGNPKYAFLTIALPKNLDTIWLNHMVQGIKEACKKWDILLLGGDTVSSKRDIFLSLTLVGSAIQSHIKYRHMAKPGDIICVNDYLGDSGAGLKVIQKTLSKPQKLTHAHFHPQPNPQEGMWLASHDEVHAMIDISDGLNCDLQHILTASKCGAVIELTNLPLSQPLLHICTNNSWDPIELALTGGEDYCLLFTIAKEAFQSVRESFHKKFGNHLYAIGQVTDQIDQITYKKNGQPLKPLLDDFQHFPHK